MKTLATEYLKYEEADALSQKLGDWDLVACLRENPQDEFGPRDVARVIASVEGEHDGPDWHWLLALTDGRSAYLCGGCDYTGWD